MALPLAGLLLANKADPDLWMHLRAGRLMVETRDVPRADVFSFSAAGRPWVSHEWLFQLLAYAVFAALGSPGLMAVKALLGAATLACLYGAAERRSAALATRALVFLVAGAPLLLFGSTCRPQLVTFLGCALIVYLFARERGGRGVLRGALEYAPWLLVPWSWLHGGFVAGAAIFVLIAIGESWTGRRRLRLLANLALALAATTINPYGLDLWRRIFETLAHPALGRVVLEWKPVWSCEEPLYQTLFVLQAFLLAAAAAGGATREEAAEWLLAGAGLLAALVSVRHLLLASILSVPVLAASAERWRRRAPAFAPPSSAALAAFGAAAFVLLAGLTVAVVSSASSGLPPGALVYGEPGPAWVVYPKGAVEFLRERRVTGRLWSDVNVGGYLVWHLYPDCRIFLDSRFEQETPEMMDDYAAAMSAFTGWGKILDRYEPDLLLLPFGAPLAGAASRTRVWRPVYRDPDFVLLARAVPAYRGLIRAFAADPRPAPRPPWPWLFP